MRRFDRDSSGNRAVKRGQAADQMFDMKAHGRRFLLPKYFDCVLDGVSKLYQRYIQVILKVYWRQEHGQATCICIKV